MLDIIGIGDTNIDIMIQVDHFPTHDEKVRGRLIGSFAGGVTANFCSAAATFGSKTSAVCKVGTDDYGKLTCKDLEDRGVDISHMVVDPKVDTYFCIVHLDATGEKALTIVETSGFLPKREEINIEYIKTARRVHMTTLDLGIVDYVGQCLKGTKTKLSLDIEGTASKADKETWKRILKNVDIAFPNEQGLIALTGTEDLKEGAQQLLECGVKTVVVTCGSNGVKIFQENYCYEHPIYKVEVRDTTGAGDCFNAVFLSGIIKGWTLEKSAKYASAAAAISIQKVGARSAQPTLDQVKTFINEREKVKPC